jgi:type III secretory pathway component EscR
LPALLGVHYEILPATKAVCWILIKFCIEVLAGICGTSASFVKISLVMVILERADKLLPVT